MKNSNSNKPTPGQTPSPKELIQEIATLLDANKAEEITLINLEPVMQYESWFLIVSALSSAHLRKLSDEIYHMMKRQGELPGRTPNAADIESGWVILDYGNIMIHFFLPEKRSFYRLEQLWAKGEVTHWKEEA